jgi:glycosyltransferase involved in cell wall biosynthesis
MTSAEPTMSKQALSVVVITKNEEKRIVPCLESIVWADEVIIVDDCSTDRTEEICKEFGAKVVSNKSNGNFDRQRNIGIDSAANDWILQLDADEIVPPATSKKIRESIAAPGGYVAFKMKRKNFFIGHPLKYAGAYDYMTKLFNKNYARYRRSIHEILDLKGETGIIDADIEHYPFNSIGQLIKKADFYTDLEAEVFLEENKQVSFKEIKYRLTWKSLKLFWKLYKKKQGYRDGMFGLIWCVANVMGTQMRWLKLWERALKEKRML